MPAAIIPIRIKFEKSLHPPSTNQTVFHPQSKAKVPNIANNILMAARTTINRAIGLNQLNS